LDDGGCWKFGAAIKKREAKSRRTRASLLLRFTGYLPACSWARPSCAKAIAAVHGAVTTRPEGYSSLFAAVCADCRMHLSWSLSKSTATFCSPGLSASRAPFGFISESFFGMESLIVRAEDEGLSAIDT